MSFLKHARPPRLNRNLTSVGNSLLSYRAARRANLSTLACKALAGDELTDVETLEMATILEEQFAPPPATEQKLRDITLVGTFITEVTWIAGKFPLLVEFLEESRIEPPHDGVRSRSKTLHDECSKALSARPLHFLTVADIWAAAAIRLERAKVEYAEAEARRLAAEAATPSPALVSA